VFLVILLEALKEAAVPVNLLAEPVFDGIRLEPLEYSAVRVNFDAEAILFALLELAEVVAGVTKELNAVALNLAFVEVALENLAVAHRDDAAPVGQIVREVAHIAQPWFHHKQPNGLTLAFWIQKATLQTSVVLDFLPKN